MHQLNQFPVVTDRPHYIAGPGTEIVDIETTTATTLATLEATIRGRRIMRIGSTVYVLWPR